jgi:hypothetical protein
MTAVIHTFYLTLGDAQTTCTGLDRDGLLANVMRCAGMAADHNPNVWVEVCDAAGEVLWHQDGLKITVGWVDELSGDGIAAAADIAARDDKGT